MSSKVFDSMMKGLEEAVAHAHGEETGAVVHDITPLDIKNIRAKLDMTQEQFSKAVGVSLPTLRHWERGDRRPNGPARVLLNLIFRNPKKILSMVQAA